MNHAARLDHSARLDKVSATVWTMAFFISKFQAIPHGIVSLSFNITSNAFYLAGYLLWLAANGIRPDHDRKKAWYGFTQFKNQYQLSAVIGTIATIAYFVAILWPPILVPASWLFVLSNLIWTIGEYHKMQHPPAYDTEYSSTRQKVYFKLVLMVLLTSIITAIATTISTIFPVVQLPTTIIATAINFFLGALLCHFWGHSLFGGHKPDRKPNQKNPVIAHSYNQVLSLPNELKQGSSPRETPIPVKNTSNELKQGSSPRETPIPVKNTSNEDLDDTLDTDLSNTLVRKIYS